MDKLQKLLFTALLLSVLLLGGCAGGGAGQAEEDSAAPATEEGASAETEPAAEEISFETADMGGNTVTADVFSQSRLTMVNVWATYCNPCLSEMPALGELAAEYGAEEFQIIGVVSDVLAGEDQELAESLIQQTGADYTHLLLNESIYYALLTDVSAVPTTFFIDENGTILDTVIGAREKSYWEELIDGLLAEL